MGRLREVIVGVVPEDAVIPTPSHFCFEYLSKPTLDLLQQNQGKLLKDVMPEAWGGGVRCASHPLLRDA